MFASLLGFLRFALGCLEVVVCCGLRCDLIVVYYLRCLFVVVELLLAVLVWVGCLFVCWVLVVV